ncbi:UNVERIFIED_CONTAM: hypothetical protein GTU68_062084 [Idotea baltica]|nr:hypothetical protein [Idotea baltica]
MGVCLIFLAACTTNPFTGEKQADKAAVYGGAGALGGALLGALAGNSQGALIGALIGGAAGGGYGYYVDKQESMLRKTLQGTGVRVQRNGDQLKLIMPGNISFATGSANIESNFYPTLNSLVLVFKEFKENGIEIVGYTDSTGSLKTNEKLSNERAKNIESYLTASGVPMGRISSYGQGPSNPIASNDTVAGRAQNRRVEINLKQK